MKPVNCEMILGKWKKMEGNIMNLYRFFLGPAKPFDGNNCRALKCMKKTYTV
jgi:hypothetical protein